MDDVQRNGEFIMSEYIFGKNTVTAYLKSEQKIKHLYLFDKGNYQEIVGLARNKRVDVQFVTKQRLDRMVKGVHQGVVAEIEDYSYATLEALMTGNSKLIVLCDQIEDPHNLGAILRTVDAVGGDGVIVGKHRGVGLNDTVAKVSTGAIHSVQVAQVTNLVKAIEQLKEAGYWVIAAENGVNAISYTEFNVDMPLVLVVGSEGKGISRLVREAADILVTIPMVGTVNSLNVSVATGILLFDIMRRRRGE